MSKRNDPSSADPRSADPRIAEALGLLARVPDAPLEAVDALGRVRRLVDEALNDAMAEATLEGASVRSVAQHAGLSPNAVPPRLARTPTLGGYSDGDGRVSGSSLERARYDSELGRPAPEAPMRFQRRRRTTEGDPK